MKCLRAVTLLSLAWACIAHAGPLPVTQFTFTGVCSDCAGSAIATLTVTGFTPGLAFNLDLSDFVSFSYAGTNLRGPFVITASDDPTVFGSLGPAFPNPYLVHVEIPSTPSGFDSELDGSWAVADQGIDDQGASSSWDVATPEPATAAIAGFGVLALAMISRYARRLAQAR